MGCHETGGSERPHILVCAPSNAAVDEVAKRLLKEGLVVDSAQWKAKNCKGKRTIQVCIYSSNGYKLVWLFAPKLRKLSVIVYLYMECGMKLGGA